jgi:3-hydroxyisobutyrate dehydrogenase-like beta-hydroxyacid dehydrogenase
MQRSLTPEHVILNHATVGIEETKSAAELVASAGAAFLDAPFTGSRDAAAAGELVYYISGDSAVLERQVDLLRISSRKILMFEQMGQATALKLATNLITASTVEALSEALALVRSAGVPGEKLQAALAENLARSGVSDFKLPTILAKDFEARFSLANMVKDMRLAVEAAKNAGFDLPAAEAFLRSADKIEGSRGLAEDFSVISEAFAPNADSPAPGSIPPV